MSEKITFKFKVGEEEKEFAVRKPTIAENEEAQKEYIKAYTKALDNGALLRVKMHEYLEKQGIWNQEKEVKLRDLNSQISSLEKEMRDGGKLSKFFKLEDGKPAGIALELRKLRHERNKLQSALIEGTDATAEGQAQNRQFNYLLSQCLVYNNGQKYWKTFDEYNKSSDPIAVEAFRHFSSLMYGLDSNFNDKLPENKFLKSFKFCDDQYRLVNKDGHLIDIDGRLINEKDQYVNDKDQVVDINGNPLDENGEYLDEQKPFLDEEGKPIILSETKKETIGQ